MLVVLIARLSKLVHQDETEVILQTVTVTRFRYKLRTFPNRCEENPKIYFETFSP
jgi:hypothetical protein